MQFDDFDKKIQEAAEHHHPAYEEKAWDKMEKLLDKHLPTEKDDKRRPIFLLLLLLVTGAGIYLAIAKPWQPKSSPAEKLTAAGEHNTPGKVPAGSSDQALIKTDKPLPAGKASDSGFAAGDLKTTDKVSIPTQKITGAQTEIKEEISNPELRPVQQPTRAGSRNIPGPETKINDQRLTINNKRPSNKVNKGQVKSAEKDGKPLIQNKVREVAETSGQPLLATKAPGGENSLSVPPSVAMPDSVNTNNPDTTTLSAPAIDKIVKAGTEKQKQHPGKSRSSSFAINFTAGPDLSTVGVNEIGKVNLTYGAGLSYSLNRFTLRSGLYVGKKVYSASPDEYHPPRNYWTNYVDLDKVEADCKLYEIPVSLSYQFSRAKTHNWFASAGLSTYLMKRETYGYYYKNSAGVDYYKSWTLKNGEKHFFSIVNLSAGYERKLNKKLSVIAEPYIKVPLDGIGFGSINLNSAGILFTLSVKPFARKK